MSISSWPRPSLRAHLCLAAALLPALALAPACTPDIDTDRPVVVMEFDPAAMPPRVSEPSFVVRSPTTGKIDLRLAGISVPADCAAVPALQRAQCEFNQYLQSLDGFPTTTTARTPVGAPPDLATAPQHVAVVDVARQQVIAGVRVGLQPAGNYLTVAPMASWPVGSLVAVGVRGYDSGLKAAGGQKIVGSTVYNLLKRGGAGPEDNELWCGAASAAAIPPSCPYLQLLAQQQPPEAARKSLDDLERLRDAMNALGLWTAMAQLGGIPKSEAAVLWAFPVHSNPVVDINPAGGLVPTFGGPDEIRLAVNGVLDPATVSAFRVSENPGTVLLLNLTALAANDAAAGFPPTTASYTEGRIVIKAAAPLQPGKQYAVLILREVKDTMGRALVPPPISVLLMARGPLLSGGRSTVSSVSDVEATQLEAGRQQLAGLLDDPTFLSLTGYRRENLAYLFAFTWGS